MSTLGKYTVYDLKHRLNKLKCCFAEKTAKLVDKQKYGKTCDDEKCNVQLLGAYIEMLECLVSEGCNCEDDWVKGGSLVYHEDLPVVGFTSDQVVKVYPREAAIGTDEFLYMRWMYATAPSNQVGIMECNTCQDVYGDIVADLSCYDFNGGTGISVPCWEFGIAVNEWSVCGNLKVAWQARGSLVWTQGYTYNAGDIVKFQGGGQGLDQTGVGHYYICACNNENSSSFHEAGQIGLQGQPAKSWIELICFDLIG